MPLPSIFMEELFILFPPSLWLLRLSQTRTAFFYRHRWSRESFTWRPPFQLQLILSSPQTAPIAWLQMLLLHPDSFPPHLYTYRFSFDVFDLETVGFQLRCSLDPFRWSKQRTKHFLPSMIYWPTLTNLC